MSDIYSLATSGNPQSGKPLAFEKELYLQINDSNSTNYTSNNVNFDCQAISNESEYLFNAKKSYVILPVNLAVRLKQDALQSQPLASVLVNDIQNCFVASLKNGSHQILVKSKSESDSQFVRLLKKKMSNFSMIRMSR